MSSEAQDPSDGRTENEADGAADLPARDKQRDLENRYDADAIQTLAEAEGLTAHARAVRIRMNA